MEGAPFLGQLEGEALLQDGHTSGAVYAEEEQQQSTWSGTPQPASTTLDSASAQSTWAGVPHTVEESTTAATETTSVVTTIPEATAAQIETSDSWLVPETLGQSTLPCLTSGATEAPPPTAEDRSAAESVHKEIMEDARTLHLYFGKGSDLRNCEIFGAMNPYLTVSLDDMHIGSTPIKGGGCDCDFNVHFAVHYHGESHCWINVRAEKILGVKGFKGDASGWAKISFDKELRTKELQKLTLNMEYKKAAPAGQLECAFRFSDKPIESNTFSACDFKGDLMSDE